MKLTQSKQWILKEQVETDYDRGGSKCWSHLSNKNSVHCIVLKFVFVLYFSTDLLIY